MLHSNARCMYSSSATYRSVTYWICRSKCITSTGAAIDGVPLGVERNMPSSQQVIGEYASLHSNQAAIHHFSKMFVVEMKVNFSSSLSVNL